MQTSGRLRPWVLRLLALLLAPGIWPHPLAAQSAPLSFDTIPFWAGSGTNRAAVVIQWNDGKSPSSLVWGFRWNGTATGVDMLRAVAGSSEIQNLSGEVLSSSHGNDPRLTTVWTAYNFGDALLAVTWSTGGTTRSQEDWNAGFWQYNFFGGFVEYEVYDENWEPTGTAIYDQPGSTLYPINQWFLSPVGAAERQLINGAWDAWSFVTGATAPALAEPSPAPTPQATPPPRVHATRISTPGFLEITFTTQVGAKYQLKKNAIASPTANWMAAGATFTATQTNTLFTLPMNHPTGREFFRLETVP